METATEVGGDYYDFHIGDDRTLTFAIGDATGHGTKARTMVTAANTLFAGVGDEDDLVHVLNGASQTLRRVGMPKLYMALALGQLRGANLELTGAGMPPALVHRYASGAIEQIPLKGMPLGSVESFPYEISRLQLSAVDTVLLMSDGFPEQFSADGKMLGYDRAESLLQGVADQSPDEIVAEFQRVAAAWRGTREQNDDMTFLVLRARKP